MALASLKEGWRRTKQSALVKLGMSDDTHDDEDFDKLVVTCKEQHALLKKVHAAILSHIAALKQATSSGQLVAQELTELYSDMSAEHRPAAALNNTAWNAAGKLSSTYIDTCIERGVLEPIVAHIGEYEQLAALWEQRRLRTKDFDYYRGKTTELEKKRDQKGMDEKIARNEQKLQHTRQIYLALTAEARTRMREMSAERFDFFGGPFTQLVAAERAFFGGVTQALEPLGETTSEDALRRAGMTMSARPSRSRPPLTLEMILAGEGQVDAGGGGSGGNWEQDDRYSTNPPAPTVTMDDLSRSRAGSTVSQPAAAQAGFQQQSFGAQMAQPAAQDAFDPWASAAVAQQQQPAVDLLGGSSEPIVQAVSQFDPFGAQPEPTPAQSGELYKAVTDYAATDQRMLALKKGDTLTKEREEDGWFFGHNERGQSGYFPPNYCKKM